MLEVLVPVKPNPGHRFSVNGVGEHVGIRARFEVAEVLGQVQNADGDSYWVVRAKLLAVFDTALQLKGGQ